MSRNFLRPARLERATYGFEVRYSIQMSYRRLAGVCPSSLDRVDDGVCPPSLDILSRLSGPWFSPVGAIHGAFSSPLVGGLNPSNPERPFKKKALNAMEPAFCFIAQGG